MSAQTLEQVLARLYTDAAFRERFLAAPQAVVANEDLSAAEQAALTAIDRDSLVLAARSYAHKRAAR